MKARTPTRGISHRRRPPSPAVTAPSTPAMSTRSVSPGHRHNQPARRGVTSRSQTGTRRSPHSGRDQRQGGPTSDDAIRRVGVPSPWIFPIAESDAMCQSGLMPMRSRRHGPRALPRRRPWAAGHATAARWPSTLRKRPSPTRPSMSPSVQYHCQENQRRTSRSGATTEARTAAPISSPRALCGSAGCRPGRDAPDPSGSARWHAGAPYRR